MNLIHGKNPCGRYQPLLDSYVSNELLVETTHDMMRHLESCAACRFELDERMKVRGLLRRAVNGMEPAPGLRSRILAGMAQPDAPVAAKRRDVRWMRMAAGIAVLLFSGLLFQVLVRNPASFASLSEMAWHQHEGCTVAGHYPAQPPTEAQMKHDLGQHYEALLPVVRKELSHYRIRDAHICLSGGREYTHFILQNGDALVSLSLLRKQDREALRQNLAHARQNGGEIAAFETATHVAFVMGNIGQREAERVAVALQPGVRSLGL